jgi:hypothetical protein
MEVLCSTYFAAAIEKLLEELKACFPSVAVLDALEVVYPQYLEQDKMTMNLHFVSI